MLQERCALEKEIQALGVPVSLEIEINHVDVCPFQHTFQPMKRDTNDWVPDGPEKLPLTPLDPGFLDAAGELKTNGLQGELKSLLTGKPEYSRFLMDKSGAPTNRDKIRVALVDLTGKKLLNPEFAGWGSTVAEDGGSIVKIAVLYAAFQLLNDLKSLASTTVKELIGIAKKAKFPGSPNLVKFLDLGSSPPHIKFSKLVDEATNDITDPAKANCAARNLIDIIGFPYIACLMLNSGLYHPSRGGLWIRWSFGCGKWRAGTWSDGPIIRTSRSVKGYNATALSLATFFTLLAQRRLVTPPFSDEMKNRLSQGATFFSQTDTATHAHIGPLPQSAKIASKVGLYDAICHEAGLIENGKSRYAVAIMTHQLRDGIGVLKRLIVDLDNIIRTRNP